MPKDRATDGGDLFIVDNSDKGWKVVSDVKYKFPLATIISSVLW